MEGLGIGKELRFRRDPFTRGLSGMSPEIREKVIQALPGADLDSTDAIVRLTEVFLTEMFLLDAELADQRLYTVQMQTALKHIDSLAFQLKKMDSRSREFLIRYIVPYPADLARQVEDRSSALLFEMQRAAKLAKRRRGGQLPQSQREFGQQIVKVWERYSPTGDLTWGFTKGPISVFYNVLLDHLEFNTGRQFRFEDGVFIGEFRRASEFKTKALKAIGTAVKARRGEIRGANAEKGLNS